MLDALSSEVPIFQSQEQHRLSSRNTVMKERRVQKMHKHIFIKYTLDSTPIRRSCGKDCCPSIELQFIFLNIRVSLRIFFLKYFAQFSVNTLILFINRVVNQKNSKSKSRWEIKLFLIQSGSEEGVLLKNGFLFWTSTCNC